jgi:TRAP-type C4-dicarboxylate transport system substrate-binding protein
VTTFRLLALAGLVLALGAGSEATAQTKTLKLGYALSATSHYGQGANAFAAEIEKQSQGRFKIEQFPASALGGEREMVEGAQLGTVDLVITSTGPVGNFVPETLITDIPFLFRDYAHARGVLDGPIGQEILAKFPARGLIALAWAENGFRHLTNKTRAVNAPDDMKGLKVRLVIMAPAVYNPLSDADKKMFVEAAKVGGNATRAAVSEAENKGIAALKAAGMQVTEKIDNAQFQTKLSPAYAEYAKKFGEANIERIRAYK